MKPRRSSTPLRQLWAEGLALLQFRDLPRSALHGGSLALLLMLCANEGLVILGEWLALESTPATFLPNRLPFTLASTLLLVLMAGLFTRSPARLAQLTFAWAAVWLPGNLIQQAGWLALSNAPLPDTATYWLGWLVLLALPVWVALALGRYLLLGLGGSALATLGLMTGLVVLDVGARWQAGQHPYWYSLPPDNTAPKATEFDEALYYRQPGLLEQALTPLPPQRPGQRDIYIVAVAGHGGQAVFEKEARLALAVLGKHFDSRGSVLLANRPTPDSATPLATRLSLATTLQSVAQIMDAQEDLLVLYLTSHGSEQHEFQLDQPPSTFVSLTPDWLAGALQDAGIRRHILLVSACYSGGYITPALATPDSLVMTAANATQPSFGCSDDAELTWFGRALLTDALPHAKNLEAAYPRLQTLIREWEQREGYDPSQPQLHAGANLRAWLANTP